MSAPQLDPQTMNRLAFIRLLHQQGVEQSRLPDPLAAACVLTFHDAVELFLILAGEFRKITIPDRGQFVARFWDNMHPDKAGVDGVDLAGRVGVKRLTTQRNSFKHDAAHPTGQVIEQARIDAAQFFEDNTPRVFGIAFDRIDMADLMPQQKARELVKRANDCEAGDDRVTALGWLAHAFDDLFKVATPPTWSSTPYSFGENLYYPLSDGDIESILRQPFEQSRNKPTRGAQKLAEELRIVRDSTLAMQKAMRATSLGIDYHDYLRFEALTPRIWRYYEERLDLHTPSGYAPTAEHWAFCEQFVISAALRIATVTAGQAHLPPWCTPGR